MTRRQPTLSQVRSGRIAPARLSGVVLGVAVVSLLALVDVSVGPTTVLAGLLTVGPCLAATYAGPRDVTAVGAYAFLLIILLSWPDNLWGTREQHFYLLGVVAVTLVSALVSNLREAQERRARLAQAQFTGAFDAATVGMALVEDADDDGAGGLQAVNPALARICRWEDGPPPAALASLLDDAPPSPTDRELVLDDGSRVVTVVTSTELPADTGRHDLRLVQVEDVTAQRHAQASLRHMALHDQLTGLPSRALVRDRLGHALARTSRSDKHVAVLFLDLDRFKHTNDSLGHDAGDALLVEVGRRLAGAVRPEDTVARLGGDEFVVILDEVDDLEEAQVVAQRLQAALASPVSLDGDLVYTSASVGVALSGGPGLTPDTLLRDADTAMYHAKGRGRARSEVFDEALRKEAVERLAVESALHQALDRSELRVHLQPIVSPDSGRVIGAEALVRWERPGRGLVPPSSFVPIAEESGLIGRIDAWVLGEAVSQAARYRRERRDPDFYVSVNLSGAELADSRLPTMVASQLDRHGMPPEKLVLEVTESVYTEAVSSTLTSLQRLRSMRVRLALDDFGTGYSSLTYVKRYPFDIIKVDQSFVRGMLVDTRDAGIVAGVLALARALDLSAVAEGVESPELARRVQDMRFPMGQGFTWSRPVPLPDLIALPDLLLAH